MSRLTGADVAASEDLTGAAAKGGDWDLEFRTGAIEASVAGGPAVAGRAGITRLATFTVTTTADTGAGRLRAAITSANAAGADTINFNISTADPNYNAATGTWTITVGTAASGNTALPILAAAGGAATIDGTTARLRRHAADPDRRRQRDGRRSGARDGMTHLVGANSVGARPHDQRLRSQRGIQLSGNNIPSPATTSARTPPATRPPRTARPAMPTCRCLDYGNDNTIGGATAADRNVISGNTGARNLHRR